jgi:hypothetical protein
MYKSASASADAEQLSLNNLSQYVKILQPLLTSPKGRKRVSELSPFGGAGGGLKLKVVIASGLTSSHSEQRS